MPEPIDELAALSEAAPSPSAQERALAALRKLLQADAVLLFQLGKEITMLASASPSLEISMNLIRTAMPALAAAPRDTTFTKKFVFR
jgi:hypothetical protein